MNFVDYRNLVGRMGRIEYNLFGNVFLVRLEESVKADPGACQSIWKY